MFSCWLIGITLFLNYYEALVSDLRYVLGSSLGTPFLAEMRAWTLLRISLLLGGEVNRSLHIFLHEKLLIVIPFGSYSNWSYVSYDQLCIFSIFL